ncbi:MAG: hypothetical protein US86_C0002G0065 [Candidatus Daviesbacteria bacterium GW2011_GWA2_38_24]|uniref:Uncharacterized protein n=1 Tax=Candidatus Daviesbacteria bacterium GW2011_GWA2_38_24 TaxID=1618422 RepID=A0A0G0JGV9_9BACT|nr:MAG: hypothetical protein US86_C0002G0065 [Candidatus Daviesbacteria bacterium GW2011_GWA2_38_24]KKQ79966.1 MAG: hypothetical protein UT01_C0023G0005 [Candidatus Daviesbacteria bacterium GW2011_GWA1_38_7]
MNKLIKAVPLNHSTYMFTYLYSEGFFNVLVTNIVTGNSKVTVTYSYLVTIDSLFQL